MKKTLLTGSAILAAIVLLSSVPVTLSAQVPQTGPAAMGTPQHVQLASKFDNATIQFLVPNGMTQHQVTWGTEPAVSAMTITVTGINTIGATVIGTSSALAGTITGSGSYQSIKVVYTNYAGSGQINADWFGRDQDPVTVTGAVTTTACTSATCSETVTGQGALGAGTGVPVAIQGMSGGTAVSVSIPIICPSGYTHVQGAVTTTSAGSSALISAPSAGLNLYIVSIQTGNSGATNSLLSFYTNGNATAMLNLVNPTNTTPFGGYSAPIPGVLVTTSTGKSFDVVTGSASTSQYINAQGCSGP